MNGDAVFDLREHAVERVGGVGNVELRIFLIREQIRQMSCDRVSRLSDAFVRPVPTPGIRITGLLLKKRVPLRAPEFKCIGERCFLRSRQRLHQSKKLNAGFQLRMQGQVSNNDLFLMEVAHLNGNARKSHGIATKRPSETMAEKQKPCLVRRAYAS